MTVLASIRPNDWDLPLFIHILGAMVLFGALALVAGALASRDVRLAYRSLLFGVIPGWIVMRAGAQWIASKEGYDDPDVEVPSWVDLGFIISEPMLILIVIATVCARMASRRERADGLRTAALVLVGIALVASLVALWAMTNKPT